MKTRYRLMRRGCRGGGFYCVDSETRKRTSLGTANEEDAQRIVNAKNEALHQPALNLQIARAFLAGSDSGVNTRTWADAVRAMIATKDGPTRTRWDTFGKEKALAPIRNTVLIETKAEALIEVLQLGTVSTNVFLRRLHNFCVNMNWLAWPILPKAQWPPVRFKEKRAITFEEHQRIVQREKNSERKAFYRLAWHLGASQSDLANLHAEDIDWNDHVISFFRMKTKWRGGTPPQIRFGTEVEEILKDLPGEGPLFPRLMDTHEKHRASDFKTRCRSLHIEGVTLHSYRYAWAERAKACGYPERYAQLALGHNSQAVHRAYAKKGEVTLPPLEEYERAEKIKQAKMRRSSSEPLKQSA